MDYARWLDRVAVIEAQHPDKRVVAVSIPGGLPEREWNVEGAVYRCGVILDGYQKVPHMRQGIFGSFRVSDGEFGVRFNTGETLK